jgi:2-oxoisovalerate dehydrogenase E2 component (dihydrolipoyl transacylase)
MGIFTFKLPDIGEGIAEAEIVAWHVKVGDRIEEDQPIADMMTDKATVEMESPVSGVVTAVAGEAGDVVAIGSMLVEIEVEGGGDVAPTPKAKPTPEPVSIPIHAEPVAAPVPIEKIEKKSASIASEKPDPGNARSDVTASPAVRARAKSLGVDLASVKSSGGHVRHADLDAYLSYSAGQGYRPSKTKLSKSSACAAALQKTWLRQSATSRISAMSRNSM